MKNRIRQKNNCLNTVESAAIARNSSNSLSFSTAVTVALMAAAMLISSSVAAMSCSVTPATFSFGNYQPLSALSVDSTGQIQIVCDGDQAVQYTIKLNAGQNSKMNPREMLNNSTFPLIYNLFLDAGRHMVWGDGINSGTNAIAKQQICSQSKPCIETIYGRIYGGQKNVHVGSYSDIISITVDYQ